MNYCAAELQVVYYLINFTQLGGVKLTPDIQKAHYFFEDCQKMTPPIPITAIPINGDQLR